MIADLICKLFLFVLKLFKSVVTVVGEALKVVADVLVDVLDNVLTTISNSGPLNKLVTLAAVGFGLWWLLASDEDKEDGANNVTTKLSYPSRKDDAWCLTITT